MHNTTPPTPAPAVGAAAQAVPDELIPTQQYPADASSNSTSATLASASAASAAAAVMSLHISSKRCCDCAKMCNELKCRCVVGQGGPQPCTNCPHIRTGKCYVPKSFPETSARPHRGSSTAGAAAAAAVSSGGAAAATPAVKRRQDKAGTGVGSEENGAGPATSSAAAASSSDDSSMAALRRELAKVKKNSAELAKKLDEAQKREAAAAKTPRKKREGDAAAAAHAQSPTKKNRGEDGSARASGEAAAPAAAAAAASSFPPSRRMQQHPPGACLVVQGIGPARDRAQAQQELVNQLYGAPSPSAAQRGGEPILRQTDANCASKEPTALFLLSRLPDGRLSAVRWKAVFATVEAASEVYLRWDRLRRCEDPGVSYIARGERVKLFMRPFAEAGGPPANSRLFGEVARQGAAMGQEVQNRVQRAAGHALALGHPRFGAQAPVPAAAAAAAPVEDEYMPAMELAAGLHGLSLLADEAFVPQEAPASAATADRVVIQPATSRRRLIFSSVREAQQASPASARSEVPGPSSQPQQSQPAPQQPQQQAMPPFQPLQPYGAFFPYGGMPQQQPFPFPYPMGPVPYGGLPLWMPQMAYPAPPSVYQSNPWSSASYHGQPPPHSFPPSPYAVPPSFYPQGPPRQF
jgi:hypothetical protein